jgi:hypothetical protein
MGGNESSRSRASGSSTRVVLRRRCSSMRKWRLCHHENWASQFCHLENGIRSFAILKRYVPANMPYEEFVFKFIYFFAMTYLPSSFAPGLIPSFLFIHRRSRRQTTQTRENGVTPLGQARERGKGDLEGSPPPPPPTIRASKPLSRPRHALDASTRDCGRPRPPP